MTRSARSTVEPCEPRQHLSSGAAGFAAGKALVVGTDGDDVILVENKRDRAGRHLLVVQMNGRTAYTHVYANDGDIVGLVIDGRGGDDAIALDRAAGPATVFGAAGDDVIVGPASYSSDLSGGAGDDSIVGGSGDFADFLDGGKGDDTLRFTRGDIVHGGAGDDRALTDVRTPNADLMLGSGVEDVATEEVLIAEESGERQTAYHPYDSAQLRTLRNGRIVATLSMVGEYEFAARKLDPFVGGSSPGVLTLRPEFLDPFDRGESRLRSASVEFAPTQQSLFGVILYGGASSHVARLDLLQRPEPRWIVESGQFRDARLDGTTLRGTRTEGGATRFTFGTPTREGDRIVVPVLAAAIPGAAQSADVRQASASLDLAAFLRGAKSVRVVDAAGNTVANLVARSGPR